MTLFTLMEVAMGNTIFSGGVSSRMQSSDRERQRLSGPAFVRSASLLLSVGIWATAVLPAQAVTLGYDFDTATGICQDAVSPSNPNALPGAVMLLMKDGQPVYEQAFGKYNTQTVVPTASISKTLAAGVMMSLVDSGQLSMSDPVAKYVPDFNKTTNKASITLGECFSHTSGLPDNPAALYNYNMSLPDFAEQMASSVLISKPGTQFSYGEASMQTAGGCAELATGQLFTSLFQQRIAVPLGMSNTAYTVYNATTPLVAGGISSNAEDLAKFMEMLRLGGTVNGKQILSANSVKAMLTDQIAGIPHDTGFGQPPLTSDYGYGTWLDMNPDGSLRDAYGAGVFGTYMFLVPSLNLTAVFLTNSMNSDAQTVLSLTSTVEAQIASPQLGGDTDLSHTVDYNDLLTAVKHLGATRALWADGDMNGDGVVDQKDLDILQADYLTSAPGATTTPYSPTGSFDSDLTLAMRSVPEPAAGLLLLTAVLGWLVFRFRARG